MEEAKAMAVEAALSSMIVPYKDQVMMNFTSPMTNAYGAAVDSQRKGFISSSSELWGECNEVDVGLAMVGAADGAAMGAVTAAAVAQNQANYHQLGLQLAAAAAMQFPTPSALFATPGTLDAAKY